MSLPPENKEFWKHVKNTTAVAAQSHRKLVDCFKTKAQRVFLMFNTFMYACLLGGLMFSLNKCCTTGLCVLHIHIIHHRLCASVFFVSCFYGTPSSHHNSSYLNQRVKIISATICHHRGISAPGGCGFVKQRGAGGYESARSADTAFSRVSDGQHLVLCDDSAAAHRWSTPSLPLMSACLPGVCFY